MLPKRKSPRLQGYDYTQEGAYFLTICTYHGQHHFGEIRDDTMHLNMLGQIAVERWLAIPEHFPDIELDAYVVMPNHVHGIIAIQNQSNRNYTPEGFSQPVTGSIPTIVRSYKSAVTHHVNRLDQPATPRPFWQGRFYDNIIRTEKALFYIRNYVEHNPEMWQKDTFFKSWLDW